MLAILILLFLGLVKMYGPGFVVEGGCFVLILSVIFFLVTPWFYTWLYDPPTGRVEDPPWDLLLILAAVGVGVVGVSVVAAYCHLQDRRLRRLYEEADIRLIGGPFDGRALYPGNTGNKWPPDPELVIYTMIESHTVRHIYGRTEEGAYHFSRTLPPVQ